MKVENLLKENIELIEEKIKKVKDEVLSPLNNNLKDLQQKLAEELCFCKVGDKITNGKSDPVLVSKIYYSYKGFSIKAYKIKRNGEPYMYDNEIWGYDGFSDWYVVK